MNAGAAPRSLYGIGPYREYLFPLLALGAAALLPFQWIAYTFIVVGHAHFLMAYRYQYKAGKMNRGYALVALILLLGSVIYFILDGSLLPILLVSGILFAFHFGLDEFTLHNEALTLRTVMSALGFALLFSALIAVVAFPGLASLGIVAGILVAASITVRVLRSHTPISAGERYLWIVESVLFVLAVILNLPQQVLGVVLLLHFANWYMGYAGKVRSHPVRAKEYWYTFAVTLLVPLVLFVLWKFGYLPFLSVFFGLAFYYAWAIAHIILSFMTMKPVRT